MHRVIATAEPGENLLGIQQSRHQLLSTLEQVLERFKNPILPIDGHIQPVVEFGIELSQTSHGTIPMLASRFWLRGKAIAQGWRTFFN